MKKLLRFHALLHKELLQLFKNPKSRIILIMPPLMQMIILGYAATMDLTQVKFTVLDHGRSAASRQLVAQFCGNGIFKLQRLPADEKDLTNMIDRRQILLAVVVPRNFERDLSQSKHADVQILIDGRNSSTAGIAASYIQTIVENFRSKYFGEPPLSISSRAWYNPNYNIRYFMVPALLAMIALLDVMLLTSLSIAREREEGTFDQLLISPYSPLEILLGKAFASITVGLIQLTVGLLLALFWFKIPFYSTVIVMYGTILVFLSASVSMGLFVSIQCSTLQQSTLWTFLVAVPLALLSGIATPIESMPVFFQYLTVINPIRYGTNAFQSIFLEGANFTDIRYPLMMMGMIAVGSFTGAYLLFDKQQK